METTERKSPALSKVVLLATFVLALATLQFREVRRVLGASAPGLKPGAVAPTLAVAGVDGAPILDSEFDGRPRVVSFWAAWCAPCRKELPEIGVAVEEWNVDPASVNDVVFLAIHEGEETGDLEPFLNDPRLRSARFAIDSHGEASTRWSVRALPTTFFVGRDGTVRASAEGYERLFVARLKEVFRAENGLEER